MDINMPVMTGIEATAQISQVAPQTRVIVVSVQDDSQYLKQAFRAGAVDFVAKPVTSAELAQAIERAYSSIQAAPPPQPQVAQQPVGMPQPAGVGGWPQQVTPVLEGHVISVIGFKGGVGKTTLAVSLAVGLAKAGKRVVLADTNLLFGDVSLFLNTRGQHTIIDVARMAADPGGIDPEVMDTVLLPHESGLRLLIAPANPQDSEPVGADAMINTLAYLRQQFEYVIVDTSTLLDEVTDAAFQAADRIMLVVTPTMPALKDAKIVIGLMGSADFSEKTMLVLNQVDKYSTISAEQIGKFLQVPVTVQIPADPSAVEAVNKGIPLISLDQRRAPSVRPLMDMVQHVRDAFEVSEAASQQDQRQQRRGLFG
jgi:pilus assembly protein CpaE